MNQQSHLAALVAEDVQLLFMVADCNMQLRVTGRRKVNGGEEGGMMGR
jgi:hypothetical protein